MIILECHYIGSLFYLKSVATSCQLIYHINVANYAYFNYVMHNELIFCGNTSHSANIFEIQKNIIRIITGYRSTASCRDFFKTLKILPLQSQYTLSLLLCAVNNKNILLPNLIKFITISKKESTQLA